MGEDYNQSLTTRANNRNTKQEGHSHKNPRKYQRRTLVMRNDILQDFVPIRKERRRDIMLMLQKMMNQSRRELDKTPPMMKHMSRFQHSKVRLHMLEIFGL